MAKSLASKLKSAVGVAAVGLASMMPYNAKATDVYVTATADPYQNALNWIAAAGTPSTDTLTVHLPDAIYDYGVNGIPLNAREKVIHQAISGSPIPASPLEVNDYPSTETVSNVIVRSEVGLSSGSKVQYLVFDSRSDHPPAKFVQPTDNVTVKDNYFIGTRGRSNYNINFRATGISSASNVEGFVFDGNYVRDFGIGLNSRDLRSKWRNNIIRNCRFGVLANAGADFGNSSAGDPGENAFVENTTIVRVLGTTTSGDARLAQSVVNYFFDGNHFYSTPQTPLTTVEQVAPYIEDNRTVLPTLSEESFPTLSALASDISVKDIQQYPHPLFPLVSSAGEAWTIYE